MEKKINVLIFHVKKLAQGHSKPILIFHSSKRWTQMQTFVILLQGPPYYRLYISYYLRFLGNNLIISVCCNRCGQNLEL